MKKKNISTIIALLVIGLLMFAHTGCDDNGTQSSTETSSNDVAAQQVQPEPVQVAALPDETKTEAAVTVDIKPAINENTITEGRAFPTLEFTSFTGDEINLADMKGKVVLVDFWAAWCGPCMQVMPDLVETYKQYHDKGLEIVGISLDRTESQFKDGMKQMGMTWQQYYDGLWWDNKIATRFGVRAIPHMVLINKNGAVYFNTDHNNGKPPLHGIELRNEIAKLLNAS